MLNVFGCVIVVVCFFVLCFCSALCRFPPVMSLLAGGLILLPSGALTMCMSGGRSLLPARLWVAEDFLHVALRAKCQYMQM